MTENIRHILNAGSVGLMGSLFSNNNLRSPLSMGRSLFPEDAVAHIYKPSRSGMTSGKARTKGWNLRFEPRSAPFIDPLMGWTGSDDTLTQVEISFPTLDAALRYAKRQGLSYVVHGRKDMPRASSPEARTRHPFSDATLSKLGLSHLQRKYGHALEGAANRNDPAGPETWASPMEVVADAALSLEAKRSILMNWAHTEYLIDLATSEGMPENNRPTRLDEVEQALLALERQVATNDAPTTRKAA